MTVFIQLTTAGTDSGPTYDLFSSPTGTVYTLFAAGITKSTLLAGYTSTAVPDGSNLIRVKSNGPVCTNNLDLIIFSGTTTTTTTAVPTTTTTTTPAVGPTTTTTSSSSSSTTTTTTTSDPLSCIGFTITPQFSNTVEVTYVDCNGSNQTISFTTATAICTLNGNYTVNSGSYSASPATNCAI